MPTREAYPYCFTLVGRSNLRLVLACMHFQLSARVASGIRRARLTRFELKIFFSFRLSLPKLYKSNLSKTPHLISLICFLFNPYSETVIHKCNICPLLLRSWKRMPANDLWLLLAPKLLAAKMISVSRSVTISFSLFPLFPRFLFSLFTASFCQTHIPSFGFFDVEVASVRSSCPLNCTNLQESRLLLFFPPFFFFL